MCPEKHKTARVSTETMAECCTFVLANKKQRTLSK